MARGLISAGAAAAMRWERMGGARVGLVHLSYAIGAGDAQKAQDLLLRLSIWARQHGYHIEGISALLSDLQRGEEGAAQASLKFWTDYDRRAGAMRRLEKKSEDHQNA